MKECIYTSEKRDELIMLALVGELPSEAIASLLKHIESCEACRERFAQISQFDKELKSLAEPEPLSLWEIARITNAIHRPKQLSIFPKVILKPLALGLCAIAFTFAGWWKIHQHTKPPLQITSTQEEAISQEDLNVIAHIDMLEELDDIEKLTKILDEPSRS